MGINSIGSGTSASFGVVVAAGQVPDPQAQQAAVSAQADLLQAVRGTAHTEVVANRVSDGGGIDIYL